MTLRLPPKLIDSFVAVALVSCSGCSKHEQTDVTAAQWFVMGPTEHEIAVGGSDGFVRLIDGTTGEELAKDEATSTPVDVVFRPDGALYLFFGRGRTEDGVLVRKRGGNKFTPDALLALPPDCDVVPCLLGNASDGVFQGSRLPLIERQGSDLRGLWRFDFATNGFESVAVSEPFAGVSFVSVSPSGELFAWVRTSPDGKRSDLEIFDFTGAKRASHAGADPIAPYWLEGIDAVLFVRRGGGIARLSVDGSVVQTICEGSLTSGLARSSIAPRVADSVKVNIEKYSFLGFSQLFEVAPFPVQGSGENRITSDDIDNYGSVWSSDRRFFAYRQARLGQSPDPVSETLVAVDTERSFDATQLGEREAGRASNRLGPVFAPNEHRVYFIADDRLCRFDLGGDIDGGRR